jgi:hypothetical protein
MSDQHSSGNGNGSLAGKDPSELVLCYLACPPDSDGFVGAVLLTDGRGRPLHFAYVSPIRPTRMQRLLYGATLDEHLKVDVITSRLVQDLPTRPHLVFVDMPDLIGAKRVTGIPTALVSKPEGEPGIRHETAPGTNGDRETIGDVLKTVEGSFNVTEPFGRVRDALKEVLAPSAS